jgi:hypothetical protein
MRQFVWELHQIPGTPGWSRVQEIRADDSLQGTF